MSRPTDEVLLNAVERHRSSMRDTIRYVHDHPELSHAEVR